MGLWDVCYCENIFWNPCHYCGRNICRAHSSYIGETDKSCHLCCKIDIISTHPIRQWSTTENLPGEMAWGLLYYEAYKQSRKLLPR